jgi:hypothetical protein
MLAAAAWANQQALAYIYSRETVAEAMQAKRMSSAITAQYILEQNVLALGLTEDARQIRRWKQIKRHVVQVRGLPCITLSRVGSKYPTFGAIPAS